MSNSAIRLVVTTVHGTYAKHATWVESKSTLGQALIQRFGAGVVVRPCRWSGANNAAARAEGRDLLRTHLGDVLNEYKQAHHYIIAHSHGGNVALYALCDKALRDKIAGVACLATPFILSRPRVLGGQDVTVHVAAAAVLLLLLVFLCFLAVFGQKDFEKAWYVGAFFFTLFSMGAVTLIDKWQMFAERLHRKLELATVSQDRLLVIRAPGDEASAALLFFQFVSELSVRLYVILYHFHQRLLGLLNRWREHPLWLLAALVVGLALPIVVLVGALELKMLPAATLILVLLLMWLGIAVPVLTWIGRIDVAEGPIRILIGGVLFMIIIILSITLLPFGGWQIALSNIFLDITAETTPPGTWVVHEIEPSPSQDQAGHVPPLEHSVVYEDESALKLICDWMERTELRSDASE